MRRRLGLLLLVLAVAVVVLGAGCGSGATDLEQADDASSTSTTSSPTTTARSDPGPGGELQRPPDVVVRSDARRLELRPWTYCYANGCADGAPPKVPADIGPAESVLATFPLEGWSFTATFKKTDRACPRQQTVDLTREGDGFRLRPAGRAGVYDVTLNGRGDGAGAGGDLFVTFRWTTPVDGPLPRPEARMAVLADHDGRVDSYGVELELQHLAADPKRATATVTVRAESGRSVRFDATRNTEGCHPEGTVYWGGPEEQGKAASRLGGRRFTYEVEVTLDGVVHRARAVWPDDVIEDYAPNVALVFEPPLPAMR